MEKDYQTKDLKAAKPKVYKDGEIFKIGKIFGFKWKGNECGYGTKADAEAALKKFREADKK
jgi:hypothetical protein